MLSLKSKHYSNYLNIRAIARNILYVIALCGNSAYASEPDDNIVVIKNCVATPQVYGTRIPSTFSKQSELRKEVGSSVFAEGTSITVAGRVFDEKCIPLSGATVRIWQANLGKVIEGSASQPDYTGSIITDNLGNFKFYTIMPVLQSGEAPKISLQVSHPDISDFETQMFFSEQNMDNAVKGLSKEKKKMLIGQCLNCNISSQRIKNYYFQIIVEGAAIYKGY